MIDFSRSNPQSAEVEANRSIDRRKKRSRTFDVEKKCLEPYYKKPKMKSFCFLPIDDRRRKFVPKCLTTICWISLWKLSLYFIPDVTPMWVGWNSMIKEENVVNQQVYYLPQIDISPTSNRYIANVK